VSAELNHPRLGRSPIPAPLTLARVARFCVGVCFAKTGGGDFLSAASGLTGADDPARGRATFLAGMTRFTGTSALASVDRAKTGGAPPIMVALRRLGCGHPSG